MRRPLWVFTFILSLLMSVAVTTPATQAAEVEQDVVVSALPTANTPHVLDGIVFSIAEAGDLIVLGGSFTQVQAANGGPILTRNRLVAFNKFSGEISSSFTPSANGTVRSVVPAADGQSVYVGGQFSQVDGVATRKVLRLRTSDGARVTTFSPPMISALIHDMKLVGDRLFIGGEFTQIGNATRTSLAELDPTSGALRPGLNLTFSGTHRGGNTHVHKFDVDSSGTTMVVTGNFTAIDGQSRVQVAMIDLTPSGAALADWQTQRWVPNCYTSFDYYLNDLDFSPDGSYFVLGSIGGYGSGPPTLCDTVSRWETSQRGQDINPTWVDYTGGDSVYALEATGDIVYYGGHSRWMNNPFAADRAGQGAVWREGIGALDAVNGIPLSWSPGRDRGRGVFDLLATEQGLWVGSDTDRIARYLYRGRIALFPLADGAPIPKPEAPTLPVDVIQTGSSEVVDSIYFDGDDASPSQTFEVTGVPWDQVRGGFVGNGQLYLAHSNGTLTQRAFDGETAGTATTLDLYGLTNFAAEMQTMTGLFYTNGRLYFTLAGQSALYMRYFEVESGIVGAQRFTHSTNLTGMSWSTVTGMFLAGSGLYWASQDGNLHRLNWTEDGADGVVSGPDEVVSGPAVDGADWSSRSLIAMQGDAPPPPNVNPVAEFTDDCTWLTCALDASGSVDPDGQISSYAWEFAGTSATGAVQTVTFAEAGDHDVTLTVTDDDGATATTTRTLTVEAPPPVQPSDLAFVGSASSTAGASALVHTATVPGQVQPDDLLVAFFATNTVLDSVEPPDGWEQVAQTSTRFMFASVFVRAASDSDAGSTVSVSVPRYARGSLVISAYRGAELTGATIALAPETTNQATHTTPVLPAVPGDWVLSYWADKTSATTGWTSPDGVEVRETGAGTGAGHLSWLLGDSDGPVTGTTAGGLTAEADSTTSQAAMATVVIAPAIGDE